MSESKGHATAEIQGSDAVAETRRLWLVARTVVHSQGLSLLPSRSSDQSYKSFLPYLSSQRSRAGCDETPKHEIPPEGRPPPSLVAVKLLSAHATHDLSGGYPVHGLMGLLVEPFISVLVQQCERLLLNRWAVLDGL